MPTSNRKDEQIRLSWQIEDFCLIYSRSDKKWYDGQIESIDHKTDIIIEQKQQRKVSNEWLIVKYKNNKKTKKIQRMCGDIKPIPNNHNLTLQCGSKCLIYSKILNLWCAGEIISIYNDSEGEWLKIKYWDTNEYKICEIQRYSKELKTFNPRLLWQSVINIPNPPKPWKLLQSNNEILPLKLSNMIELNKNEFIVSGYSHDNEWSSEADKNGIYKYNINQKKWQLFIAYPQMFFSQYHNISMDYKSNIIYFVNGISGVPIWKIDIQTKKFTRSGIPNHIDFDMLLLSSCYGALSYVINSEINIFWGNGNNNHLIWNEQKKELDIVYEFDDMKNGMISHGMIYNKNEKYFILFGGYKGKDLGRSDEIWKYIINDNKWIKMDIKLPNKMQSFGCVISLNCKYIIILGGNNLNGLSDKIYILNLLTMKWRISKILSPFKGIGYGNFIVIQKNDIEYVHLVNGMYSSMEVPIQEILAE